VLAAEATRRWFDAHHLEDARVQSPGVCTQSVMSTVAIRSNLMGHQCTHHGEIDVDEETENQRAPLVSGSPPPLMIRISGNFH